MSGPYETRTEVAELVSPLYALVHKRGAMQAKSLARLVGVCSAHAVELGTYDQQVLDWLARNPPEVAEVIADLIDRAGSSHPMPNETETPSTLTPCSSGTSSHALTGGGK